MVLAQLSDPHVGAADGDPERDLAAAVGALLALHRPPDAVLVSGDLAEHATAAEYAAVRTLLAALPMPVHVLAGNHDDRDELRAAFPPPAESPRLAAGALQRYSVRCGDLRLVACDSTVPGRDGGCFDDERCDWLARALGADMRTPTIVALHHPPFPIGIPVLDRIGLPAADRRAMGALLERFPQVVRVVCGHVHLGVAGRAGRCGALACPSTWRPHPELDLEAQELTFVDGPAGFALHALCGGELASHVRALDAPARPS